MMVPKWVWEFDATDGGALDQPISPVFTTQFDAEQWLGEHWRSLAERGVVTARLMHDGIQATPAVPIPQG